MCLPYPETPGQLGDAQYSTQAGTSAMPMEPTLLPNRETPVGLDWGNPFVRNEAKKFAVATLIQYSTGNSSHKVGKRKDRGKGCHTSTVPVL